MSQHTKGSPHKHSLYLPEALVAKKGGQEEVKITHIRFARGL
jgi:hypothetical protein